jgi:hypothetical protein
MSEEELQFYKEIIYAVKVFDVNFQNISKELYKEIERLNNIIDKVIKKAQRIIDYGFDYDGFNNEKDLKGLIDMLVDYAEQIIDILKEKE